MIKKILIYLSIFTTFIFCFLFGKYINTLAMGNFNNSIGTIPVQMDIENYNNVNLYDSKKYNGCFYSWNATCSINNNTMYVSVNYSANQPQYENGYAIFTKNIFDLIEIEGTYTFTLFFEDPDFIVPQFRLFDSVNTTYPGSNANVFNTNSITYTFTESNVGNRSVLYLGAYVRDNTFPTYKITGIMITKGVTIPEYYSSPFKFGYNASLSYVINGTSSTTVNYYFNNNTYTKTTSYIDGGYLLENYYLPFNIDSKGYISLPNINFGISSISNNTSNNTYSLQLELTPVFSAYYKGELTTNIYTKLNYMSNDLFFSGITFSSCKSNSCLNNINAGNLSLTNPKTLVVTEQNDTGNISTTNISTYYNDDIRNRNYFEFNNYLNVGFRIGSLAETYSFMNGRNYTFGISSLASRIVDNQTTTTPLPNNPSTFDKYNTCSAWYDIPCQLGNAVTYVIYEAPIISPILTFIVSFITIFSSLVTFVDLFRSFGIVFGCFVLYMFIELLHKYSK